MLPLIVALVAMQQVPSAPTTVAPARSPAPVRRPAATSANVEIRVIDRSGSPAQGVRVTAEGPRTPKGCVSFIVRIKGDRTQNSHPQCPALA